MEQVRTMSKLPQQRLIESVRGVCGRLGETDPALVVGGLDDESLLSTLESISDAQRALEVLGAVVSSEVAARSDRELGYRGLAQRKGYRTSVDLVQSVTGQTRADLRRATAAGRDLRAAGDCPPACAEEGMDAAEPAPWYASLPAALSAGELSRAQYETVRRGLGDPPLDGRSADERDFLIGAWRQATTVVLAEAADRSVEDLGSAARLARDTLDPVGLQLRFEERFARRSFRAWIDQDGQHHARIVFDDEAAVWVHTIMRAALRPRRGPRFADPSAASDQDESAVDDPRTNEQLQYDTLIGVLRTGAAADPAQAFGDRQPGIRIVVPERSLADRDEKGRPVGAAYAEETGQALPATIAERYQCDAGTKIMLVAGEGKPLDVGRDQRLFTVRQREALALRDGGCFGVVPNRRAAKRTTFDIGRRTADAPTSRTACCCAATAICGSTTRAGSSPARIRRTTSIRRAAENREYFARARC
ncbi:hypothetical protein AAIB33_13090 [Microbacterium sp. AZCO]|uniref:hypothetical protein n=1 Tax=Microbacterium sp. AZCO TaxID=3142976 RepID=UPI0031F3CE5B